MTDRKTKLYIYDRPPKPTEIQKGWRKPTKKPRISNDKKTGEPILVYDLNRSHMITPSADDCRAMLMRFLDLAKGPSEAKDVLEFAKRWGTLGLCLHGISANHLQEYTIKIACRKCNDSFSPECTLMSYEEGGFYEPISWWRTLAGQAEAIITLAAMLEKRTTCYQRQVDPKHWKVVKDWVDYVGLGDINVFGIPRDLFAEFLSSWINTAGLKVNLDWDKHPRLVLTGGYIPSVLPALALQLILTVGNASGLAFCAEAKCGKLFELRKGQPVSPSTRNHYCEDCGRKAAMRAASKRYYKKKVFAPQMEADDGGKGTNPAKR